MYEYKNFELFIFVVAVSQTPVRTHRCDAELHRPFIRGKWSVLWLNGWGNNRLADMSAAGVMHPC